jgi:signal transduction histidine kinase
MGGAGLGLSIAKWIIDRHNGTVHVASKPGQGSTFTVRIPIATGVRTKAGS